MQAEALTDRAWTVQLTLSGSTDLSEDKGSLAFFGELDRPQPQSFQNDCVELWKSPLLSSSQS